MGEADCLTQSLSSVSVATIDSEGNPPRHLTESISFGRFATETLGWERWSSFPSNHYVEEAKRYSKPGSVAQKKAFFEAHYKTIASKKAAALLELSNINASEQNSECNIPDLNPQDSLAISADGEFHECPIIQRDLIMGANEHQFNVIEDNSEETCTVSEVEKTLKLEKPPLKKRYSDWNNKSSPPVSSSKPGHGISPVCAVSKVEKILESKKPPLKKHCSDWNLKNPPMTCNTKPVHRIHRVPPPPVKPIISNNLTKENTTNATPSVSYSESIKLKPPPILFSKSSIHGATEEGRRSPEKSTHRFHHRKEEMNETPANIKTTIESWDKKRSTPKTLHTCININGTPQRNIGKSRVHCSDASKVASTHYSTLLRTPISVAIDGTPKCPVTTPKSEFRRAKTPLRPLAQGSNTGPKWAKTPLRPLAEGSNTGPKCGSNEFSFITKERAVKRKEKLEERLHALEVRRMQEQKKFKEKAECELRKLSQSLCFKARPLPDFYKRRAAKEDQAKKEGLVIKHAESRKQERKANISKVKGVGPPKAERSTSKKMNVPTRMGSSSSSPSLTMILSTENTSPNIQH